MTLKDRIISTRIEESFANEMDRIDEILAHNPSYTTRYLLKLGILSYKLLTSDKSSTDIELETILDNLKPEKKEKLLELLINELGHEEVERVRRRKGNQLVRERALAREEKDDTDLNLLPPVWAKWDSIDFHNQSIENLSRIYKSMQENRDSLLQYMKVLKERKEEAKTERPEHTSTVPASLPIPSVE